MGAAYIKRDQISELYVISMVSFYWAMRMLILGEALVTRFYMGIEFELRIECHS